MAQVWNEGIPAAGNGIAADVADIEENLQFLSAWAKERRSIFTYNGGTTAYTIKCKSAFYHCKDKVCWWDAELTTDAIGTPVASDWYYLYLDNSGITSGTEITKDELIWSSTEPAWATAYAGWYNGDDRCIFAVRTNSTPNNILEFFHDGDFVLFADQIAVQTSTNLGTSFTDSTALTMPIFSTKALVVFHMDYVNGQSTLYWRTNGQTGTTGHIACEVAAGVTIADNAVQVITDSGHKLEIKEGAATNNTADIYENGWYFPIGL